MNITKFGHACLYIEKNNHGLLIDPGNLTEEFSIPNQVQAILLTHSHPDHLDIRKISDILTINPQASIYAHAETLQPLYDVVDAARLKSVTAGVELKLGDFTVEFSGGHHAIIHPNLPKLSNLGIMIDEAEFFYPGDALDVPAAKVKVLALPASAPWMKISETLDYLAAVNPKMAIPVHDAILSEAGRQIIDGLLQAKAKKLSIDYCRIDGAKSVEL